VADVFIPFTLLKIRQTTIQPVFDFVVIIAASTSACYTYDSEAGMDHRHHPAFCDQYFIDL